MIKNTTERPMGRNFTITVFTTIIWVILCTLGFNPANEPIDSIAVIWPGAILHGVGAILLGGWGVVATVLSAVIVDIIKVGTVHATVGYMIPDFLQALIPAYYYRRLIRRHGVGPHLFRFGPYLLYAVILSNLVGAITGTLILNLGITDIQSLWFPMLRWLVANIPIAIVLGYPLLRCLGPTMVEENLIVKGWWK